MANEQQLYDYLHEHLPYMLKMVRYTHTRLQQEWFYLDWNAYFESFSINARSLVAFLTNGDAGNFKAHDFSVGFRARNTEITAQMQGLNEQVFHLAKKRPIQPGGKFDTEDVTKVTAWIEENFEKFLQALRTDLKARFNETKSRPEDREGPKGPETTSPTHGPTMASAPQSVRFTGLATVQSTTSSMVVTESGLFSPLFPPVPPRE